jgi:uncharacterized membrane protein YphA (DoxX/SURF4 family)
VLAIVHGAAALSGGSPQTFYLSVAGSLAIASGLALLAGFLTPIAGSLTGLGAAGIILSWFSIPSGELETKLMSSLIVVMAVAITLLGPGALSLDARLFGRREIIIPRVPRSPQP